MKEHGVNLYSSGILNEQNNAEEKEINHILKSLEKNTLTREVL